MKVTVYVEGGGDRRALKRKCRAGFTTFFRGAGLSGRMPRIFASGGRQKTYDSFCIALSEASSSDFVVLLVDAEGPVAQNSGPWAHLKQRDSWNRPNGATHDNAHLMVQCMETWFLADKDALARYFGDGFNPNALPRRSEIEDIPKYDLHKGLKNATRQCAGMGAYHKGRNSFAILAQLNPKRVTVDAPHAARLIETLIEKSTQT